MHTRRGKVMSLVIAKDKLSIKTIGLPGRSVVTDVRVVVTCTFFYV